MTESLLRTSQNLFSFHDGQISKVVKENNEKINDIKGTSFFI